MNTAVYPQLTPLQVALGAYNNLSKKAKKEFLKMINLTEEQPFDVTKTKAYKESMRDIEEGRVYEVSSVEELKKIYAEL